MSKSVLVISDSHGKSLQSNIWTHHCQIKAYSISGLQWVNNYNPALSVISLINEEPYVSLLNSTSYVLFLVATNSVRCFSATRIIDQIDQIVKLIHSRHPHLHNNKMIITSCIPCFKTTKRFNTIVSLKHNISCYNRMLHQLSQTLNFIYCDLCIPDNWIAYDLMHIKQQYHQYLANFLLEFIDSITMHQYGRSPV